MRIETNLFNDFFNSLSFVEFDEKTINLTTSSKVFNYYLFETKSNPDLGLERFKEVLKYYGDPNVPDGPGYKNVVQTYVHNRKFLSYIITQGGRTDGLLNYAKNYETIKFLINEYALGINKPYNNIYPLHSYLNAMSMHDHKVSYEIIDKLFYSGIELDSSIIDNDGNDFKTLLKKLDKGYQEYIEYDKKRKGFFDKDFFIISDRINEIIGN